MVKGGLARKRGITAKDVNQRELKMGIRHEMEHTSSRPRAKQIALDHLAEHKDYYTQLNKAEKRMKERKRFPKNSRSTNSRKKKGNIRRK